VTLAVVVAADDFDLIYILLHPIILSPSFLQFVDQDHLLIVFG
jgi:hypothetical protein